MPYVGTYPSNSLLNFLEQFCHLLPNELDHCAFHQSGSYLITEDVVVDVVLLGGLRCEYEGLHESPHWLIVIRKLAQDLHDHPRGQGGMGVHLLDFGLAIPEVQLHDLLMDFLLAVNLKGNLLMSNENRLESFDQTIIVIHKKIMQLNLRKFNCMILWISGWP